jgi:hypothetical protein
MNTKKTERRMTNDSKNNRRCHILSLIFISLCTSKQKIIHSNMSAMADHIFVMINGFRGTKK